MRRPRAVRQCTRSRGASRLGSNAWAGREGKGGRCFCECLASTPVPGARHLATAAAREVRVVAHRHCGVDFGLLQLVRAVRGCGSVGCRREAVAAPSAGNNTRRRHLHAAAVGPCQATQRAANPCRAARTCDWGVANPMTTSSMRPLGVAGDGLDLACGVEPVGRIERPTGADVPWADSVTTCCRACDWPTQLK